MRAILRGMTLPEASQDKAHTPLTQAETPHSWRQVFNRIFSRHLMSASLLVCMVVALAGPLSNGTELTQDPDLWWHLANARSLCTTHHFIRVEPYSFAVQGQSWINPEWLAEVPYWLGYVSFGLMGIHLVALFAFCANLLLVYFRCYSISGHKGAAFWTAVLGFFLMTVNCGARTIVVAYLAMSVLMAILEASERGRKRLLWLLPPLFCLWINLHGSWIIGLGFLGLYILCGLVKLSMGVFEQDAFLPADRNRLCLVFVASLGALMVNPYGWQLIWNPFDMLLNQKVMLALMVEWQPLSMGTSTGKAAAIFLGLLVVANCVRGRKWKVYELAFVFFAWYFAFSHQRFAFLACIVTAPWLAADLARSFFARPDEKTMPAINALFVAGTAGAIFYLLPTASMLQQELATRYPLNSIASLQPSWRTFNDYGLGGMMIFNGKPTFVDSRNDTFEHHGILQKFLEIGNLREPLKLLDLYRIDHVLIQANSPLSYVLERSEGWRVTQREGAGDNLFETFEKVPGPAGITLRQCTTSTVTKQGFARSAERLN